MCFCCRTRGAIKHALYQNEKSDLVVRAFVLLVLKGCADVQEYSVVVSTVYIFDYNAKPIKNRECSLLMRKIFKN